MDVRDDFMERVRHALGRKLGQKPLPPPEPLLRIRYVPVEEKIERFRAALESLTGTLTVVDSPEAAARAAAALLNGRTAVASNHPFLVSCGIPTLPRVAGGITDPEELRNACVNSAVGITSAYCLLADTGTIVLRATPEEPRMISLLPPVHLAVVAADRLLSNLDEMLSMTPRPFDDSSAMVLITGPSRTGDIEQFLVRGVHGPAEVHTILVRGKPPKE
ncbi:MAG TPA: lactate utilization protein [Bryobacteraceae bacterium]|nr:lactate utilization protein [Bryobacteraceae bacterium]